MKDKTKVFIDEVKERINQTDEAVSNLVDNIVAVVEEIQETLESDQQEGIGTAVACLKDLLSELGKEVE